MDATDVGNLLTSCFFYRDSCEMKKFFKFGKDKNKTLTPEPSPTLSKHGSSGAICGYEIREKDLGKLHKAAWNGELTKVKQLAKKDASPLDKENR